MNSGNTSSAKGNGAGRDDEGLNQRGGSEKQQQNGDGPFRDHAAWDIGLRRLGRFLGFRGQSGFFLVHKVLLYRTPAGQVLNRFREFVAIGAAGETACPTSPAIQFRKPVMHPHQ